MISEEIYNLKPRVELVVKENRFFIFWRNKYFLVVKAYNTEEVCVGDELTREDLNDLKFKRIPFVVYQDRFNK